jgi:hypothetical protein
MEAVKAIMEKLGVRRNPMVSGTSGLVMCSISESLASEPSTVWRVQATTWRN